MKLLFALLVGVTVWTSCQFISHDAPEPIDFKTLNETPPPRMGVGTLVIRDTTAWNDAWSALMDRMMTIRPQPAPPVDFSRWTLAAIFWPETSGCFSAVEAVREVVRRYGRVEIRVGPLPDLGPCDAVQSPYQVIVFEKNGLPILFTGQSPRP